MRHSRSWIARQQAKGPRPVAMADLMADAPRSTPRAMYHDIRRMFGRFDRHPVAVQVGAAGFHISMVPL